MLSILAYTCGKYSSQKPKLLMRDKLILSSVGMLHNDHGSEVPISPSPLPKKNSLVRLGSKTN
jgi:hypothetical protein